MHLSQPTKPAKNGESRKIYTSAANSQLKCPVYAFSFVKMLKIAFTGFGGQVYLKKTMVGRLDGSGAGALRAPLLLLLPV